MQTDITASERFQFQSDRPEQATPQMVARRRCDGAITNAREVSMQN